MNQDILNKLKMSDLSAHVQVAFDTPSGQIVWELLRRLCFMAPAAEPEPVGSMEAAASRIGLTNLFRKLEHLRMSNGFSPSEHKQPTPQDLAGSSTKPVAKKRSSR